MTVVRLQPAAPPKPEVSAHDRIMAALNKAIEDQTTDEEHQKTARGIMIIWYHDYGSKYGDSYIAQGLNTLEALGLLRITADDISEYGLDGAPGDLSKDDPA